MSFCADLLVIENTSSSKVKKTPIDSFLAIEPQNGNVLMKYDESDFLDRQFPTGSLIKIFTNIAALRQDMSFENFQVVCKPSSYPANSFDACWYRPGHGKVNMIEATAYSCNRFFRVLGEKIEPKIFFRVLVDYGLIPVSDLCKYENWSKRKIVEAMVGTGTKLQVPPKKLLLAYAALFNGGILYTGRKTDRGNGEVFSECRRVNENPAIIKVILQGMEKCCTYGSGTNAQVSDNGDLVAGKTGTAAYFYSGRGKHGKTHGLFIGFYPAGKKPKIGLIVFSLEGRGSRAADIAGQVICVLGLMENNHSAAEPE